MPTSLQYQRFVEETTDLCRSIVIKCEDAAKAMNLYVSNLGFTLPLDKREWKYYLNLAGEYHFLDHEECMLINNCSKIRITSLDTLESIEFTKENLKTHIVTRAHYGLNSRLYNELLTHYPKQELLIRGVINPVDLDIAVHSEDHSILWIDETLIESNENNLRNQLEKRIKEFSIRWNNPAYAIVDDLYVSGYMATLFYNLPGWVLNIRLANAKTYYAHSFHIREFLKSHGRLDRYFNYLTKPQMLFLYRNLLYIERNVGKQDTFNWLIDRILTKRRIGLAEFDIYHNLDYLPRDHHVRVYDEPHRTHIRPEPEFKVTPLNQHYRSSKKYEYNFEEMLEKQRSLAFGNQWVEEQTLSRDTPRIQNSRKNYLKTKALESAVIDWDEAGPITKSYFYLNHWLYWAHTGRYNAFIRIPHPREDHFIELTMKDAFILFLYLMNKAGGLVLEKEAINLRALVYIPTLTAKFIRRYPNPSVEALRALINNYYIPIETIRTLAESPYSNETLYTPFHFNKAVDQLFKQFNQHRTLYTQFENYHARGYAQSLVDHLYGEYTIPLVNEPTLYSDWLVSKGIFVDQLTFLEYETLIQQLVERCTGVDQSTTYSLKDLQRALIQLMRQLSSYTIHYIKEINPGPILFLDWSAIRVGDLSSRDYHSERIVLLNRINYKPNLFSQIGVRIECPVRLKSVKDTLKLYYFHPVRNKIRLADKRYDHTRLPLSRIKMKVNHLSPIL